MDKKSLIKSIVIAIIISIIVLVAALNAYTDKNSEIREVKTDFMIIAKGYSDIINEFRLVNRYIRINNVELAREHLFRAEDIFSEIQALPFPTDINISGFISVRNKILNVFLAYNYSGLSFSLIAINDLVISEYEYFVDIHSIYLSDTPRGFLRRSL